MATIRWDQVRQTWVNARMAARMTQKQVADAIGVSVSSYQKYEYGQRTPSLRVYRRLRRLLRLPDKAPQRPPTHTEACRAPFRASARSPLRAPPADDPDERPPWE